MFKVVVHGSTIKYNRVFTEIEELNNYLRNLMKSYKTFDIFKDGKLVKIENFDENNIKENTIEIISTHVKEKDLRVPFFAINITPIFNLIFG